MRRRFLRAVNNLASVWFWFTISGAFYTGITYVIPVVYTNSYDESEDAGLINEHVLEKVNTDDSGYKLPYFIAVFLLVEMVVNWFCLKAVKSNFQPNSHDACSYAHCNEETMTQQHIELNLQHLKPTSGNKTGSYTIPANSIYNNNGHCAPKNGNTLYLMSVPAANECQDVGSCKAAGHCADGGPDCGMEGGNPLKLCRDRPNGLVFPYWSWKPCFICQLHRPPRTHHCVLCGTCVLKRDHHCFFTGSCVGLHNQRHFIVFTFWSFAATAYSLFYAAVYTCNHFMLRNSAIDLFLPATVTRWFIGCTTGFDTLMVCLLYSLVWFCFTSLGFFIEQARLVTSGVTSFEIDNRIKIVNTNSINDNIRGVFGKKWLLNFIFPAHTLYKERDDGVHWNNIKI